MYRYCHYATSRFHSSPQFIVLQTRLFSVDSSSTPTRTTTPVSKNAPVLPQSGSVEPIHPMTTDKTRDNDSEDSYDINNLTASKVIRKGQVALNTFFHETSRRSQRRRRQQLARQRQRQLAAMQEDKKKGSKRQDREENDEEYVDTRSIRQLLYPTPWDAMDESQEGKPKEKKPISHYIQAFRNAWRDYMDTWRGNSVEDEEQKNKVVSVNKDSRSSEKKKDDDNDDDEDKLTETMTGMKRKIRRNVRRNTRAAKVTALSIRQQIRERTGIKSADDFKRVAADVMTLVANCLNEFVSGYREGRDAQLRKMLQEDLAQQQKEEAKAAAQERVSPTRLKRRPKRRVLRR
jgi:hypothetical protein